MTSKIFHSILVTSILVLTISLVIITSFLYDYFMEMQANQLKDQLSIASVGTEQSGKAYLQHLKYENFRLTWISKDGTVIFDSKVDHSIMDNHIEREEISEAFETGEGSSSRYSSTLTEKTIYEAVLLNDGTVLRISMDRKSGLMLIVGMFYLIVVVIIIAVILSAILANKMSKKIIEPLDNLDLDNPTDNDVYEEILPLLNRINKQNKKIERKVMELKRQKEEFSCIIENMREGLLLLDKDKTILTINSSAKGIFNTNEECIGKNLLAIEQDNTMGDFIEKAVSCGYSEIRIKRNEREYQFNISRIETNGEIIGTVILALDITEQVNAELLRREFSANVSHELKTPLQSITGSAELIENGLVKKEDLPRFVGHIRKEATRLVNLVEDIIRLSQLDESGEMPKEKVSLYELSKEVCSVLSDSAEKKHITINLTGDDVVFFGVKQLLFEVIYNLCDNAIKYNYDGGKVDIEIADNPYEITLTVSDNGIGIPVEYQPRVFERFYRVDKSHSKKSGGTGLGLSIVKHAVIYHGGRVVLKSEENKGTSIKIILPKIK